jgi:hypothetical protein
MYPARFIIGAKNRALPFTHPGQSHILLYLLNFSLIAMRKPKGPGQPQIVLANNRIDAWLNMPEPAENRPMLELHHLDLDEVPCRIGECKGLRKLDLSFNNLSDLLSTVGRSGRKNIRTCKLERLKDSIEILYCLDNYFQEIPDVVFEFRKLRQLSFANNKISKIPSFVLRPRGKPAEPRLPHLQFFWINSNRITEVHHLVEEVEYYNDLRHFQLDSNPVEDIPYTNVSAGLKGLLDYKGAVSLEMKVDLLTKALNESYGVYFDRMKDAVKTYTDAADLNAERKIILQFEETFSILDNTWVKVYPKYAKLSKTHRKIYHLLGCCLEAEEISMFLPLRSGATDEKISVRTVRNKITEIGNIIIGPGKKTGKKNDVPEYIRDHYLPEFS